MVEDGEEFFDDNQDESGSSGTKTTPTADSDHNERINQNNETDQSRVHLVSEKSKNTAEKKESFHEADEGAVEDIAELARQKSSEIGEMQNEFDSEVHERTEEVLGLKEDFEEETVPAWNALVGYDQDTAEGFAGIQSNSQTSVAQIMENDFKNAALDTGFFAQEMLEFNDLFTVKKRIDGSEYAADAEAAGRRGTLADSRREDLEDEVAEYVQGTVSEVVDDVDLDTQWSNFQDRVDHYEEVKEKASEATQAWENTKSESQPDESTSMVEDVRNLLGTGAEEAGEDAKAEFESQEQERTHVRAWNAYQAATAREMANQFTHLDRAISTLEEVDSQLASQSNMYSSVREGVENINAVTEVDGVGQASADQIEEEGFGTLVDIALLDDASDLRDQFQEFSFERNQAVGNVRDNADEIYETARGTLVDLAEQWGLDEATDMINDRSGDDYESRVIKQVAGIYTVSDLAEGEIEDARDSLSVVGEYREDLEDAAGYVESELEETYDSLNELEGEQKETPEIGTELEI